MPSSTLNHLVILISSLLNNKQPEPQLLASINLTELYSLAGKHSLLGLTAFALEHSGINSPSFTAAKGQAIRKVVLLSLDRVKVTHALSQAHIWLIPLKGSILKDYYPALGMRESSDCDILFDPSRANDVKDIMKSLGFSVQEFGMFHHDTYFKPPVSNFEMHKKLFGRELDGKPYYYYADTFKRLIKDDGSEYSYHFSHEDFYIFMIAHEHKHYSDGGTGLRSLVDTYVFVKKFNDVLNWDYVSRELSLMDLDGFERNNRELSLRLFDGQELTDELREMLGYIAGSGTYGSTQQAVINRLKSNPQSKMGYVFSRIFLPVNEIRDKYPFFYEHKLLRPLLPIHRVIRAIKKWRITREELRTIIKQK